MEYFSSENESSLLLSSSPALSPVIVPQPNSPAKSLHVQKMDVDQKMPTHNIFDDSSFTKDVKSEVKTLNNLNHAEEHPHRNDPAQENLMNKHQIEKNEKRIPPRPSRPPAALPDSEMFMLSNSQISFGDFSGVPARNHSFPGVIHQRVSNTDNSAPKFETMINSQAGSDAGNSPLPPEFNFWSKSFLDNSSRRKTVTLPHVDSNDSKEEGHHSIIRTSYPSGVCKIFGPADNTLPTASHDTILILSLRRSCNRYSSRVAKIKIPSGLSKTMLEKPGDNPNKAFDTLDFDDAHLFHKLRKEYKSLTGPFRVFSARGLHHIEVNHSQRCSRNKCLNSSIPTSTLCVNQTPGFFTASQKQYEYLSEANLLELFKRPSLAKGQYNWVQWVHSQSCPALHLPSSTQPPGNNSSVCQTGNITEDIENSNSFSIELDFIEGWRPWRLFFVVTLVKMLATAAALLWIFLGTEPLVWRQNAGFRGASGRVDSGVLIGMMIMFLGWTTIVLWVAVSWIID